MTTPALLLRDPDVIKQVLVKDFDLFSDRGVEFSKEGLGANLFHADGETWRVLRTRFTPIFSSGKLRNMFHLVNERGDKFLDYIRDVLKMQPEQNVQNIARMFTISSITACAFGLDIDYNDPSINLLNALDDLLFSNKYYALEVDYMFPGILKKLNLSILPKEINSFFLDLVKTVFQQRNGVPTNRNDFMDLILEMRQQKVIHGNNHSSDIAVELTDGVIAAQAFVFYVAGFETSSTTLGFLLYEISQNPEIQEKLLSEVDEYLEKNDGKVSYDTLNDLRYMTKVINETLRKYPLIDPLQRRALTDYKVPGTDLTIKKDQLVYIPVRGLHYDQKYFPNPDVFDPERFSAENSKTSKLQCFW
ncbi:cytochrome p450 domain-containing protein [Phthorimaea operculella]|nr:cytochrome p450 domain-containing protein [Phthorimaea operculella]